MSARVMVFLDYQNVHFSALEVFHPKGTRRSEGHVDPWRVAREIVLGRPRGGSVVGVRVYRGLPLPDFQRRATEANDRQAHAWARNPTVTVIRRPLRYPRNWPQTPAQEKGIDVAIAVDFVRLAIEGAYDVGVLFSCDTDLMPAIETVGAVGPAHVEVAAWSGTSRLRLPGSNLPWCHYLSDDQYQRCRDITDYTKSGQQKPSPPIP